MKQVISFLMSYVGCAQALIILAFIAFLFVLWATDGGFNWFWLKTLPSQLRQVLSE
jgi:hypothetical protein